MSLVMLLGGARSGKSTLAVQLAGESATFVATGTDGDEEMAERIRRHRAERPAGWTTMEEPLALGAALGSVAREETAVVDCLSLWVSRSSLPPRARLSHCCQRHLSAAFHSLREPAVALH